MKRETKGEMIGSSAIPRSNAPQIKSQNLRKHEIYDNTYYIPNNKIRLLDIPINSSLTFQKFLYFHFYYNIIYFIILFTTFIFKLWILKKDFLFILAIIFLIIWAPVEL